MSSGWLAWALRIWWKQERVRSASPAPHTRFVPQTVHSLPEVDSSPDSFIRLVEDFLKTSTSSEVPHRPNQLIHDTSDNPIHIGEFDCE